MRRYLLAAAAAALAFAATLPALDTAEARPRWERGAAQGPPPWAPAWGWRARQRGVHPGRTVYRERAVRRGDYEWRAQGLERGWSNGRGNGRFR